jgi:hypothetical protein
MAAMHRGRALMASAASFLCFVSVAGAVGQPGPVTLASGRWGSIPWRLAVSDNRLGGYCATVTVGSRPPSQSCGAIIVPPPGRRLSFFGQLGGPPSRPGFIAGAVSPKATEVEIILSNAAIIRTPTIAAAGMVAGVRFFISQIPCPQMPMSFVARDASGQVVAVLERPAAAANQHVRC